MGVAVGRIERARGRVVAPARPRRDAPASANRRARTSDDAARRGVGPAAAFTAWRPRACGAAHPADLAPRLVSQCGHLRARLGDDGGRRGSAAAAAASQGRVRPSGAAARRRRRRRGRRGHGDGRLSWRRGGRGGPCVDGDRDDPGEEQQRDFGGGLHLPVQRRRRSGGRRRGCLARAAARQRGRPHDAGGV